MLRFRPRLTYANVMATLALFIALGAGAYAAGLPRDSVKSKQIKAGAVKGDELADNAVTSPKVADGSLLRGDFAAGQLPGDPGPATGPASGVLSGSYPGPGFAAGVDEVIPVAVAATNIDGSLRNEAHRAPVTGPVTTSNAGTGVTDFTVPGVVFSQSQDGAVCSAFDPNIALAVGSLGGRLRVRTSIPPGTMTNTPLYCAIFDNL
jgi:hypothetical protein